MNSNNLTEPLSYESAVQIFKTIRTAVGSKPSDEDLDELYRDFLSACVTYANMRAQWPLMTKEQKMSDDPYRTSLHNNVLMALKVLIRYMERIQLPVDWFELLIPDRDADIMQQPYRKLVGDFACHVADIMGVEAR